MDGIDGLAFAAGMARVAGAMMVFPSLRLIVVVEDGGSLVLWKVRGCRRLIGSRPDGGCPGIRRRPYVWENGPTLHVGPPIRSMGALTPNCSVVPKLLNYKAEYECG